MPRPPLPDEKKRKQVGVRINPEDRERFEASAKVQGTGVGIEIERLALAHLDYQDRADEPTRKLIDEILADIEEIERRFPGKKPWHQVRAKRFAVAEMLRRGPIEDFDPDNPSEDEATEASWSKIWEARQQKEALARGLNAMGVKVDPTHPDRQAPLRSGLLGLAGQRGVLADYAFAHEIQARQIETNAIDQIEDEAKRNEARALLNLIKSLDDQEAEASAEHTEAMKPYWEEERRGRDIYREMLKERAVRNRDSGKPYRFSDLHGTFFP